MQPSNLCNAVIKFLSTPSALFISLNHINNTPVTNTKPNTNHGLVGKRLECRRFLCGTHRLLDDSVLGKITTLLWNRIVAVLPKWTSYALGCRVLLHSESCCRGIIFPLCNTDLMLCWADGQLISFNHHRSQWRNADCFQSWVWPQDSPWGVHLCLLNNWLV